MLDMPGAKKAVTRSLEIGVGILVVLSCVSGGFGIGFRGHR